MKPASAQSLFDALLRSRDPDACRALLADSPTPPSSELIERLASHIRECLPKDPRQGEILTEACLLLAEQLDEPLGWAYASRSRAYVFTNLRKCAEAEPFYEKAARLFGDAGQPRELGRTRIAQAENLTYLSEYRRAQELALEAHGLLKAHGGPDDLAKVHIFAGNLFNRLNRYADALREYDRARQALESSSDYMAAAAVELNRASVLVELNRFAEALTGLETAREYCDRHSITVWADILDRNIARLYFSLGRYSDALRSLNRPRPRYRETGDARRLALCDQACANVYLQLNMFGEALELAERARSTFEKYSNRFEAAECLGTIGIALSERGNPGARESFLRAMEAFRQEGNRISEAGMSLQLGRLELRLGNHRAAGDLASAAAEAFESAGLAVRGAYARLVRAQSFHAAGSLEEAFGEASAALLKLDGYHADWVSWQCRDLLATLHAARGEPVEAERLYREALSEIESLRGNLELDEFRTSFGKDKYQVYENLVALEIQSGNIAEALRLVERSRSRTLLDLLEHRTDSVWRSRTEGPNAAVRNLREELNGLYSRLSQPGTTLGRAGADRGVRERVRERERELMALLREAASNRETWAALEARPAPGVSDIREMLSPDEALIEYYTIRDRYCAFVVGREGVAFHRDLAPVGAVERSLRGLSFQLSKFHLSGDYLSDRQGLLLRATEYHLRDLHEMLVAPLERDLSARSLAIVPHGPAHYVPFQALHDGSGYLIDRYDVVYAPSAAVMKICREKPVVRAARDLVLAVGDETTPAILEEARVLADLLPNADVFVGDTARADLLAEHAGSAGKLHIAAHGVFRGDNPLFSSLKLADTWLNLVDVFNLRLGSELTTLSGCETGLGTLYGGDELLGLAQGFLCAGTPSLVVSLWRVNDRSTSILMKRFYEELLGGTPKPEALRRASLAVREEYPHPYYWAPFILLGKS